MSTLQDDLDETGRRSIGAKRNPASQEAILDAAEAILSESGVGGFSIEAVARRARAGKPTIYRWWPNRTVLLLDVYRRFKTKRPLPDTGTLRGDLLAFLDIHLLGFWKDSLCGTVYRSIIAEAQVDAGAAEALFAYQLERKSVAIEMVEKAKKRGEIAVSVDGGLVIDMIASYAWHQLLIGRLAEGLEQAEAVVDTILSGLAGSRPNG